MANAFPETLPLGESARQDWLPSTVTSPIQPLLHPIQIGSVTLPNNLLLAPMAGITDRPFRTLCKAFGVGLTCAEMVSSDQALWDSKKSLQRLAIDGEPGKIAIQILGTEPQQMAEAAKACEDIGADIIDINMGCPAKKVCKVAAGSALLKDEKLVAEIIKQVVKAVEVPVTLKIRTGWSPTSRNALTIARIAVDQGITALTIHGRTRGCSYQIPAEYETLQTVAHELAIPVIANGDIDGSLKAKEILASSGASGIMIARSAQGRPWIFAEIAHFLASLDRKATHKANTVQPWQLQTQTYIDIISAHLEALYEFYGPMQGVRIARKHLDWYTRQYTDAKEFRTLVYHAETPAEQLNITRDYLSNCDHYPL